MSFRGWGQIIKPWLLRSLTRYAVQPLFVRFSWKHWNVLTLPSCGKQNRNFVYIRETHTHTHTRQSAPRSHWSITNRHTHIAATAFWFGRWLVVSVSYAVCFYLWSIWQISFLIILWLGTGNKNFSFSLIIFCLYCPIDFCVTVQTRSAISLSVLFSTFLYLLFEQTKKSRAQTFDWPVRPKRAPSCQTTGAAQVRLLSHQISLSIFINVLSPAQIFIYEKYSNRVYFYFFRFSLFLSSSSSGWQYRL